MWTTFNMSAPTVEGILQNDGSDLWDDLDDETLSAAMSFAKGAEGPKNSVSVDEVLAQSTNDDSTTPSKSTESQNDQETDPTDERARRHAVLSTFRPSYLRVTDLTNQHWCEQMTYYDITHDFPVPVKLKKVDKPAMTEGSNLHLARELLVHDIVPVKTTSIEDSWAIRILNLLTSVQGFLNGDLIAREIPIFGDPFGEGVFVVGIIDELRFDPEMYMITMSEFKTRLTKRLPSKPQQNQHRFQLMIYKKLFDDLVKGELSKDSIVKYLSLDLDAVFGIEVQDQMNSHCVTAHNVGGLLDVLFGKMQALTCVNCLSIEYVHQGSCEAIGQQDVVYDEIQLRSMYTHFLGFWRGQRDISGVDIEDTWKCQKCDFVNFCEWRIKKCEELTKRDKQQCL